MRPGITSLLTTSSLLLGAAVLAAPASAAVRPFAAAECQQRGGCGSAVVDSSGRSYVTDGVQRQVYVYSAQGALIRTITGADGAGRFMGPTQVVVDAQDRLYVADNGGPVQVYTAAGGFVRSFADAGSRGIALDPAGNVYAVSAAGVSVSKFSPSGEHLAYWPLSGSAANLTGIAYNPVDQRLYAADTYFRHVLVLDRDLEQVGTWGAFGAGPGDFPNELEGVAVDGAGAVYVGGYGESRIRKFAADGTFLGTFGGTRSFGLSIRGTRLYAGRGGDAVAIDLDQPTAVVAAGFWAPRVDTPVRFSAEGSEMPFGTISAYQWDLDGDGTYERSTGTVPSVDTTFSTVGPRTVGLQVIAGGASATASVGVDVQPAPDFGSPPLPGVPAPVPPAGRVGVSINDGALYTNDPNVTLRIVWPQGARSALAANDGGFRAARGFPLTETVRWTLATSGPERLPKTIYLRYDSSGSQTYTDDIILDETAPKISAASFAPGASPRAAAKTRSFKVRLKASDRTSGVASAQFATKRSRPFKPTRYRRSLVVTGRTKPKLVRVQDRAGNWSSWRRVR